MAAEIALAVIKKLGAEAFDQESLLVNFALAIIKKLGPLAFDQEPFLVNFALAIIKKLGPLAFDQEPLPVNFTDDFQWLREELTKFAVYLQYADNHTIQNEQAKRWIQQVRDVEWDAEDIIEEYAVEALYGNRSQSPCLCSYIIFQLKFRYNMGRRIRDVRQRMMLIIQDAEVVHNVIHLDDPPSTCRLETLQEVQKPLSSLDSKSPNVAIEDKAKYILQLLQNPEFPVIAVVGMGGMGKIFLLQYVLSSAKQRFAKFIWLSINQYQSFGSGRLSHRTATCMDRRNFMSGLPICQRKYQTWSLRTLVSSSLTL